jgi:hypothetical protein
LPEDKPLHHDSEITTQVKRSKKPHDKFRMSMQFNSLPIQLDIEAKNTNVELKDLTPNHKKHSFGKVRFKDGALEACIYPLTTLDSILWFLRTDSLQKGRFVADIQKTREILALIMRTNYFLRLTKERKLQYLWRKGFFSNINTIQDTLTIPEKRSLQHYEGIMRVT